MSSLDFAHFKKIGQDKKCATLQHPDGHEIKIAIGNLSPALKKKLEALPLHQYEGSEVPVAPLDAQSPAGAQDAPAAVQAPTPQEAAPAPAPQAQAQAPAPEPQPQEQPAVSEEHQKEPAQQQEDAPEQTVEQIAEQRTKDDLAFANDLHAGHIQPKTYRDLFNDKSTIGKIGTIFGLMLSGAGAGLTHQPNALLAMMDKQITNDLDAQKTNQTNKQNWKKLAIENTHTLIQNNLLNSQAAKNWPEADMSRFMNDKAGVISSIGTLRGENNATIGAVQIQQDFINNMSPGPDRDRAQLNLNNVVIPAAFQKIKANNMKSAEMEHQIMNDAKSFAASQKVNLPPSKGFADPEKEYDAIDTNELDKRSAMAKKFGDQKAALMDPKSIPVAHADLITKEAGDLRLNRANKSEDAKAFIALQKLKNAGQLPLSQFVAEAGSVLGGLLGSAVGPGGAIAGSTAGGLLGKGAGDTVGKVYERARNILINNAIAREAKRGQQTEAQLKEWAKDSFPSWTDDAKTEKAAWDQLNAHHDKDVSEEKADYSRRYGLYTKPPQYKFVPSQKNGVDTSSAISQGVKGLLGPDKAQAATSGSEDERSWFEKGVNALGGTVTK